MNRLNRFHFGVLSCLITWMTPAHGQTLFKLPTAAPLYESYPFVEDCMAAVWRIESVLKVREQGVDTTIFNRSSGNYRTKYKEVSDTGINCVRRWKIESVPEDILDTWMKSVLVVVPNDDSLKNIYFSRLDTSSIVLKMSAYRRWSALLGSTLDPSNVKRYLNHNTRFISLIHDDSVGMKFISKSGRIGTLIGLGMYDMAKVEYDSLVQFMWANRGKSQLESVSALHFRNNFWPAVNILSEEALLEKLALSNEAYFNALDSLQRLFSPDVNITYLNKPLPLVKAKYWYTGDGKSAIKPIPASTEIPYRHKVNAIAFLQGCHVTSMRPSRIPKRGNGGGFTGCNETAAVLNRLKTDYPEVEITIFTKTFGVVGSAPPSPPAEEAAALANYYTNFYKIKATVAVEETEFFKLGGLDDRRIDLPSPMFSELTVHETSLARFGNVIIVDRAGKILFAGDPVGRSEIGFRKLVETLVKRK